MVHRRPRPHPSQSLDGNGVNCDADQQNNEAFIAGKLPFAGSSHISATSAVLSAIAAVLPLCSHSIYLRRDGCAGSRGQRRCPVHLTPCELASHHCCLFSLESWMVAELQVEGGSEAVSAWRSTKVKCRRVKERAGCRQGGFTVAQRRGAHLRDSTSVMALSQRARSCSDSASWRWSRP